MSVQTKNMIIQNMRAIAIIMVVLQHSLIAIFSEQAKDMAELLYSVDVNVFFAISGYLFQKKNADYENMGTVCFFKKKGKALAIPYLFWGGTIHSSLWNL